MKRKHLWFPCGLEGEPPLDEWPEDEYRALMRETDWEKWITDSQWRDLLEGNGGPNLSKLKRRLAEFYVVLNRVRTLDSALYESAIEEGGRLWLRFWAIQVFGKAGVKGDYTWDQIREEGVSKGGKT